MTLSQGLQSEFQSVGKPRVLGLNWAFLTRYLGWAKDQALSSCLHTQLPEFCGFLKFTG